MNILSKLLSRSTKANAPQEVPDSVSTTGEKVVELPSEPYVFECRSCGKVFEARRRRPTCSECDSDEVTLMS